MLTIAVLQQKGGAGKTTLAVNLAAAAHLEGQRTLIVDMDQQASAFAWSLERREGSRLDGLTVVRADRALTLPRFAEMSRGYDAIFLDGPPRRGDITQSAAVAADIVLLPVTPAPYDVWALDDTTANLDLADGIREQLGRKPVLRAFVINRAATGTLLAQEVEALIAETERVLAVVRQRTSFPTTAGRGETVLTSTASLGAREDIEQLWRALKGLTNGNAQRPKKSHPQAKRKAGSR
jgi:chromosome partitioning protein